MKLYQLERVSPAVRDIAWKAQSRLCARYRMLTSRGKKSTVAVTTVARELAAFMWARTRSKTRLTAGVPSLYLARIAEARSR